MRRLNVAVLGAAVAVLVGLLVMTPPVVGAVTTSTEQVERYTVEGLGDLVVFGVQRANATNIICYGTPGYGVTGCFRDKGD